jgi:hypothetical protein
MKKFKEAIKSIIIITTGIGIPVLYHTYKENNKFKK